MANTTDGATIRWNPKDRSPIGEIAGSSTREPPRLLRAMRRGAAGKCPNCGRGRLFKSWLGVAPQCDHCLAPLGQIRADDAPPYFTVFIVAHLVIGAQLVLERMVLLSVGTEMVIFVPGTLALTLVLIRPVKGATVGLMMKLGFMKPPDEQTDAG